MQIVFWQNILCHLQSSYIRELAATSGVQVTLVVDCAMTSGRAAQGWAPPDFGNTNIVISPDHSAVRTIIDRPRPRSDTRVIWIS